MSTNKPLIQYYDDPTFYFTFAGVHSEKYNLFLTSTSVQKVVVSKGATTNYATPMYGNGAYLLGTNRTQMQFQYNVAAEGMDRDTLNEIMLWLEEGTTGFLVNDDTPWWGYDVVLEKVGDVTWTGPRNYGVVEFQLTFKTYGDVCAKAASNTSMNTDFDTPVGIDDGSANKYGIPEFDWSIDDKNKIIVDSDKVSTITFNLYHIGNKHLYFKYTTKLWNLEQGFTITCDGENIVKYIFDSKNQLSSADAKEVAYYSQYGFLTTGSSLLELTDIYPVKEGTVNPLIIPTVAPVECTTLPSADEGLALVGVKKDEAATIIKAKQTQVQLDPNDPDKTPGWQWSWEEMPTITNYNKLYLVHYSTITCTIGNDCNLWLYKHNNL